MLNRDVSKFRLGLWTPSPSAPLPNDGRSLSRMWGPFNAMAREDGRLELVRPPVPAGSQFAEADWDWFSGLDALYMLDPCRPADFDVLRLARAAGCAVWVDYIDNLLNVHESNPHWQAFANREQLRETITRFVESANAVTCTTAAIKARFPLGEKFVVLPESCRWPMCPLPRRRVVTWRGLGSHRDDLESVLPQIAEVARMPQFSQWDWAFLGEPSYKIYEAMPRERLITIPWHPPYQFMEVWGGLSPYLHLAPLVDNAFNRAKTPLVWLEATSVGAAVIGPALPEWAGCGGVLRYRTPEEFGEILKRELFTFKETKDGDLGFHPAALEARQDVYPGRTLKTVNQIRWKILNRLAGVAERPVEVAT